MFCTHCGAEINDDAFVCVKCGCRVDQKLPASQANAQRDDTMLTVIKVFLILGCIAEGWLLIPLAWCILGSLILVGPFIYTHKLLTAMNLLSADYNVNG